MPRSKVTRRDAMRTLALASGALVLRARVDAHGRQLNVFGSPVELRIASLGPRTIRITVVASRSNADLNADGALLDGLPARSATIPPSGELKAGELSLQIASNPLGIAISDARGRRVQEIVCHDAPGQVSFLTPRDPGKPLLGFGEGGQQFDRHGAKDAMRNGQGGYQLRTHGGRVPIQWLIGTEGWGLYIHQPLGEFDLSGADQGILTAATPLPLDVFLVVSDAPAEIMREYARITGLPEMPPKWSFGYQQSHRTLTGPDEVVWVARTMRDRKLPCDALIYLGTDFTPSGWNTHNGEFTWNPANFPSPKKTIEELHELHYKVVLHVVIEGKHLTGTAREACAAPEPSGRTPDGKWPDERSVGCYWPYHKPLYDLGVDGFWPDQGDGLDAPSRLNRIRMYWEGPQLWRPNERPYALHRNGYAGMARYGAFLWSGDVYSTWETLRTHVPVAINTALSGIPYWGTDIGGFVPTPDFTGELFLRWFQFGAFCPLFRAHGRTWHLRLPWGWNTGEIGPDETSTYSGAARPPESELHNSRVEPICRKYLELRYRLMPYLYSAVRETSLTGMPIIRALWLHYPDDPGAVARGDEYLWGRDILVAPIVEKGATTRSLYLPRGSWYDLWTEEQVEGGREVTRPVDLETMPLYIRAGAIIPFGPVTQYTDEIRDAPLDIVVYPGADGRFDLYDDDGRTFDYRKGEWTRLSLTWSEREQRLYVAPAAGSQRSTRPREIRWRIAGKKAVTTIRGRRDV